MNYAWMWSTFDHQANYTLSNGRRPKRSFQAKVARITNAENDDQ